VIVNLAGVRLPGRLRLGRDDGAGARVASRPGRQPARSCASRPSARFAAAALGRLRKRLRRRRPPERAGRPRGATRWWRGTLLFSGRHG
jgi:hypothetical protein